MYELKKDHQGTHELHQKRGVSNKSDPLLECF